MSEFVQMLAKVSVGSHWMDSQCFSSLLATDRRCMRESIVSNIVSTIQLLFTTSACPASQPSRVRRGIETHTHTLRDLLHLFCLLEVLPVLKPPVNPACQSVGTWLPRLASSQKQRNKS